MNRLVAQAMEEGALGLTAAWHAKGPENPEEVVEMAKVVKRYGGYYGVHVGSEGFDMMEELAKTLRIARESQIPVHVYHLKMRAKANWGRIRQVSPSSKRRAAKAWRSPPISIRTPPCNIPGAACSRAGCRTRRSTRPLRNSKTRTFASA
jgi:N-acyl-D-amino-acid deacylase